MTSSTDEEPDLPAEGMFEGIMSEVPAADEAEKDNAEDFEEVDLLFTEAMDTYEANAASIDECLSVAGKMLDAIPMIIPKDSADSGIFDPIQEYLVFDKIAAIPAGVSYGQTRSGRNVRNPLDRRLDILPTGSVKVHGLAH